MFFILWINDELAHSRFKYAITDIQVNKKGNYQKLWHVAGKNQIKIFGFGSQIFGKILLNFWIYFTKSKMDFESKSKNLVFYQIFVIFIWVFPTTWISFW